MVAPWVGAARLARSCFGARSNRCGAFRGRWADITRPAWERNHSSDTLGLQWAEVEFIQPRIVCRPQKKFGPLGVAFCGALDGFVVVSCTVEAVSLNAVEAA